MIYINIFLIALLVLNNWVKNNQYKKLKKDLDFYVGLRKKEREKENNRYPYRLPGDKHEFGHDYE